MQPKPFMTCSTSLMPCDSGNKSHVRPELFASAPSVPPPRKPSRKEETRPRFDQSNFVHKRTEGPKPDPSQSGWYLYLMITYQFGSRKQVVANSLAISGAVCVSFRVPYYHGRRLSVSVCAHQSEAHDTQGAATSSLTEVAASACTSVKATKETVSLAGALR
jgi:hypothetical protein